MSGALQRLMHACLQSVFYGNKKVCGKWTLQDLGRSFFEEHAGLDNQAMDSLPGPRSDQEGQEIIETHTTWWDTSVRGRTERLVDTASSVRFPLNRVMLERRLMLKLCSLSQYLVDYIACQSKNPPRRYRRLGRLLDSWQMLLERAERLAADVLDSAPRPPAAGAEAQRTSLASLRDTLLATLDIGGQSSGSSDLEKAHDFNRVPAAIACQQKSIARQVVLLGFELELYAPDELLSIYWYLGTVLESDALASTAKRAEDDAAVAHGFMARASLNVSISSFASD